MTTRLEDLLTKAVRERAVAYALLSDAQADATDLRAERDDARLEAMAARELLAYHGLTPVKEDAR